MSSQSGNSDRYRRLKSLRKRLDKDGSYWKHDRREGGDGTWVANEDFWTLGDKRKSQIINKPDPELRYSWSFGAVEGKLYGGNRPSKRKSVK